MFKKRKRILTSIKKIIYVINNNENVNTNSDNDSEKYNKELNNYI